MGRKDRVQLPYELNLCIPLEGLEGVPPETSAQEITSNWIQKSVIDLGEESKGFQINNQLQFKTIRDSFATAIKDKAENVVFEPEDWRFLKRCWDSVKFSVKANEVVIRINQKMNECAAARDRAMSDQDKEPISSQN